MPYGNTRESTGRVAMMPKPDPQHTEHSGHEDQPVTADDLLEEVSIDGMCGVY
jgi:mycofactocin precursor